MSMKFTDQLKAIHNWLRLSVYIEPNKTEQTWIFRPNEIELYQVKYDDITKIYKLTYLADDIDETYKYSTTEQSVIIDLIKIILNDGCKIC